MALKNPRLFGLNIKSSLSDVQDVNQSLNALNLSINDLDVIRGSSNAGATRGDWISFSRLNLPIYKSTDRFYYDSLQYESILRNKSGYTSPLFGNLNINGSIEGNSIRYKYVSGTGSAAAIKFADISTSLVSAWSSNVSPATSTSPIFYGSRVGIITGGSLQFGTAPPTNQIRFQTSITPNKKEFDSEVPTHRIKSTINGKSVTLYVMKGIPFIFTGNFRNFKANIRLTSLISNSIRPSWKIVETENLNNFTNFKNVGTTSSTINYKSTASKERNIQFYYNPNYISAITITSAGIFSLSEVGLPNLTSLNLAFNEIRNFPNFNTISPNIQSIDLRRNPLYLSDNSNERKFGSIITKIPETVLEIHLGETFYGSIGTNVIGNRFAGLKVLNLSGSENITDTPYFHPDDDNSLGTIPNVSDSCETYDISRNDFRTIASSSGTSKNIKDLTGLITLNLRRNYYLEDPSFSISSTKINAVYISFTNLQIPNLSGRSSLQVFYGDHCRNRSDIFSGNTYKFSNCNSLTVLSFINSNTLGRMPKFTNLALTWVDFRNTELEGGDINGDNSYVIPEKTFEFSPNLQYILFYSQKFLQSPIHPNAFTYLPNAYYLQYMSGGRSTGDLPSLVLCPKLTFLILHWNRFTNVSKPVYNFSSNPEIYYVDMSYNEFTNAIPIYKNLSRLTYLYLNNNQFTSISKFENLPALYRFHAQNNLLSGNIPSFGDCPRLGIILLQNNRFSGYTIGSFLQLGKLVYLDLSNNLLSQTSINQIINDLEANYNNSKRGGVSINLRGNDLPGSEALTKIEFLKIKGWSIVYE